MVWQKNTDREKTVVRYNLAYCANVTIELYKQPWNRLICGDIFLCHCVFIMKT